LSWFLTGEHRPYDRRAGIHTRMPVRDEFYLVRSGRGRRWGLGAWELAARFSNITLNDKNIQGNNMTDFTAGLNWYLNPYSRVKINYVRAFLEDTRVGNSLTDAFGLRLDTEF
jgi:phosphate-selective porin OprO/OprP